MAATLSSFLIAIAFLSIVSVGYALGHHVPMQLMTVQPNSQRYWKTMLPNTPMPQALLDSLSVRGSKGDQLGSMTKQSSDLAYDNRDSSKTNHPTLSQTIDDFGYEPETPSSLLHQDLTTSIFLLKKDLYPGAKHSIHFKTTMLGPRFPSPTLLKSMPSFSSNNLNQILNIFNIVPGSKDAKIMNHTLVHCQNLNPINGNIQFCTNSLEKMVNLVKSKFNDITHFKAVSMALDHNYIDALVPYEVVRVSHLADERSMIVCHKMSFPYAVFYCHQPKGATAYKISLVRVQDGVEVEGFAMCHENTLGWNDGYVAFKTLGVKPGASVCHFLQQDNVIWYRN